MNDYRNQELKELREEAAALMEEKDMLAEARNVRKGDFVSLSVSLVDALTASDEPNMEGAIAELTAKAAKALKAYRGVSEAYATMEKRWQETEDASIRLRNELSKQETIRLVS